MSPFREPLIEMRNIDKSYRLGDLDVPVLRGIQLVIDSGEFVAIMGTSGSGKSTLMNIIGCLDKPSSGTYHMGGQELATLNDDQLAWIRNQRIGFVFQQFNLLPRATALENVMLPMIYAGIPRSERLERATRVLAQVGLAERMHNRPNQLSGGQQQRVAIARALVNQPSLILADEPTGALDTHTSQEVMNLLSGLNQNGITVLIVTHEPDIAAQTRRTIRIQDGCIVDPVQSSAVASM